MTSFYYRSIVNGKIQSNGKRLGTWLIGIIIFLAASLFFVNTFVIGQFRITHFINATVMRNEIPEVTTLPPDEISLGYLVNNNGCRIAARDPFDNVSRHFMHKEKPIKCKDDDKLPLIESNDTDVYINFVALNKYYNKSMEPHCCWRSFTRTAGQDNRVTFDKVCHNFTNSARINTEFIKVECFQEKTRIYHDYHAFVPLKEETEKRCEERGKGSEEDRLSILILGLDAVSRLNFHRMMPKTVETLKKLQAVELLGYNKVADNTFPNLVPVLLGYSAAELAKVCQKNKEKTFDDCPFLWKEYAKQGYRTIFAEDACSITTFNYLKSGFHDPPTDYYLRPYCIAMEDDIGNNNKLNANLCVGSRKNFENLLGYVGKVATKFAKDRYFAFCWQASLTHDFFNYPQLGDDTYNGLILNLTENNLLNNTLLIIMSDHGLRWGDYRQTYQGRMEESLPFVFFLLPDWWKKKYSTAVQHLKRNVFRLTTPYDLHETIKDILRRENLEKESIVQRNKMMENGDIKRGISLFTSIPTYRNCSMADIPEHWCMCHMTNDISIDDNKVQNATVFLLYTLNKIVSNYPECAVLKLKKLMHAKTWIKQFRNNDEKKNAPWIDYTITVETEPGGGIFEATIRDENKGYELVGVASRLNLYGNQSACINDANARLYCYCR